MRRGAPTNRRKGAGVSAIGKWLSRLGRPAVIAHRGASARAPENSLAALRLAAELGADGVEFDVQACASGELVVFHDRTLARCTGAVGELPSTPWSTLETLSLDRIDREARGERIPTLDEWLAEAPKDLFLNLEVKADELAHTGFARACAEALVAAGRAESAVLSAFHPASLAHAASVRAVARGALVDGSDGWRTRLALGLLTRPEAVHPEHLLVTPERVAAWKRLGLAVATWTVDDPGEAERCLDCGVDAIMTNVPDVVRPVVERWASSR